MPQSDWSQFIPEIIGGFLTTILGGLFLTYLLSERFKKWSYKLIDKLRNMAKQAIEKWLLILPLGITIALGFLLLPLQPNWLKVTFPSACYLLGIFSYRGFRKRYSRRSRRYLEYRSKYLTLPIPAGIGNAYLDDRYIDPPLGDVKLGEVEFHLEPNSLIFDTNEQIRSYLPIDVGSKQVEIPIPEDINSITDVYFLINSGNSKQIYINQKVGEIVLLFQDAPPIVTELILGQNIREWSPGNPGDFVREITSPKSKLVWKSMNKSGSSAIIDCLEIPNYRCMMGNFLKKIIFVHNKTQHSQDTLGVHFMVLGISLKIEYHSIGETR